MNKTNKNIGFSIIDDLNLIEKIIFKIIIYGELIFGIFLCCLIIIFYIKLKSIREYYGCYMFSLTFDHLVLVVWCLFLGIIGDTGHYKITSLPLCVLTILIPSQMIIQSQLNFLGLFINRYICISSPFKYQYYCSTKLKKLSQFIINLSAVSLSFLSLYDCTGNSEICYGYITAKRFPLYIISAFGPIIPSLIFYFLILRIANKHAKSMESQMNSVQTISKSSKLTLVMLIVVAVSWIIYILLLKFGINRIDGISYKICFLLEFLMISPVINISLIIIFTNSKIKQTLKNLFCKERKISPINTNSTN